MAGLHVSAFMNSQRDPKEHPTPFRLPVPWLSEGQAESVTEEERVIARAELLRRSAFADR